MSDTNVISLTETAAITEEELLDRAKEGDRSAFGTLYLRHRDAARRVASMCTTSRADAEDAVAEGFAKVFAALPRMAGRNITFRPYLLTCVRNAATDRIRRERRIDLREAMPETPGDFQADDVALRGLERNLVGEALQALPSRWRTVLWLTEVEGLSPAEVSRRIGIKPNAVAALAYRARKGLREAYLQAHLTAEASTECRATVGRLGNYVRGDLAEKDRLAVQVHLDACAKCRGRRDELTDVNATLRNAFLPVPLLLGGLQRKWFDIFSGNQIAARVPEIAQLAQLADSPMANKALAGLTMVVLALSGAALPQVLKSRDEARANAAVVAAATSAPAAPSAPAPAPVSALSHTVAAPVAAAPAAVTGGGKATAAATTAPSEKVAAAGATRSRLFRWGDSPDGGSNGGTRHRLLNPGGGDSNGGLIGSAPVAPVASVVESTIGGLELEGLLPVHIAPADPSAPLSISSAPLGLGLAVDPVDGLQIGTGAPDTGNPGAAPGSAAAPLLELNGLGVNVGVGPGALSGVVDGVLQPVRELLETTSRPKRATAA